MIVGTIALIMMLFGGGGTLEHYLLDIKKPAKAAVESKQTVNESVDLSKELGKELKELNEDITKLKGNFLDLHANYDATSADFKAIVDQMINLREEGQQNILDTRSAMKERMTKEEWTKVFK